MTEHPNTLAKLTRPNLAGILSRDRLYKQLDKGREQSIIWVGGPPGSGKTTLIADYLDTWAPECVWYQVDPGDADVATFFYYMAGALPEKSAGQPATQLPLFTAEYQSNLPAFTRRYFRELFAHLTVPFALVFDNYQDVPPQSRLHEVLRNGLEELPAGGCTIFISRRDPPTAMARFRANDRMHVLDPDDLKLTRDESDALAMLRQPNLNAESLQSLYEKTRGWAAGLVLLLGRGNGQTSVTELPKDVLPQVVFDYLAGEIFDDLDADTRDLLLKTAWFPQFTAPMADELSGHENCTDILKQLTREDYFVTARHGQHETVYQFHPLLREFLLRRTEEGLNTRERAGLQGRAARLLEAAGQIEDAVALCITSRDWDSLIRIIHENAEIMLTHGRGETLEQWLEELPPARLRKSPWMLYWLASCRLSIAPRESRRLFENAYELFYDGASRDIAGLYSALAGVMYAILNDLDDLTLLDRWITEALALIEQVPEFPSAMVEARVTCYTFMSLVFRQPAHPDIEKWGERTAALLEADLTPEQLAEVAITIAAASTWTGRFHHAEAAIQSLHGLLKNPGIPLVIHATLYNIEASFYSLTGNYEKCMLVVDKGIELAESTGIRLWRNRTLIFGISGALGVGDIAKADELSGQLDQTVLARSSFDSCMFRYYSGWKAMLEKDSLKAYQEVRVALRIAREIGLPFFEVLCGLSLGQVLCACGDSRKARRTLKEIRGVGLRIQNRLLEYMSFMAFAQITIAVGRPRSGRNALRYALGLGREKGFSHTLWWQPEEMARLCIFALEEGIETDYVRGLIRQRKLIPAEPPLHLESWPWRFRVHTFGHFGVTRDDEGNLLSGRGHGRPIEVLKVAIAMGGRDVSVDRITDALWPNIDRDYAHRSFNTALHRLRKILGEDTAVTLNNNQLTLSDRYFWIDIWALDHALNELRVAMRGAPDAETRVPELADRILDLYQGGFLTGDEDQSWAVSAHEQLRHNFIRFINDVGHWWEEKNQSDKALELYFQGLKADELAEGIYRRLMLCFKEHGRHAEAIDTYNRCCKTLKSQLRTSPSRETQDLYKSLVHND